MSDLRNTVDNQIQVASRDLKDAWDRLQSLVNGDPGLKMSVKQMKPGVGRGYAATSLFFDVKLPIIVRVIREVVNEIV